MATSAALGLLRAVLVFHTMMAQAHWHVAALGLQRPVLVFEHARCTHNALVGNEQAHLHVAAVGLLLYCWALHC